MQVSLARVRFEDYVEANRVIHGAFRTGAGSELLSLGDELVWTWTKHGTWY